MRQLLAEGHLPVAVERAAGIDAHRQRRELGVLAPAHAEKVADRALDRRLLLAVPVEPQDALAPVARRRHPDLLDRAGALDVGQRKRLVGGDVDRRRDLPAAAQVAGRRRVRALGGHPALALLARKVLRADGPRLGIGQPGQVAEVHAQAVESPLPPSGVCDQQVDNQAHRSSHPTDSTLHDSLLSLGFGVRRFIAALFSSSLIAPFSTSPASPHSAGPIRRWRNQTSSRG